MKASNCLTRCLWHWDKYGGIICYDGNHATVIRSEREYIDNHKMDGYTDDLGSEIELEVIDDDSRWILIDKMSIPDLIKILQSFVVMLLLSVSAYSQTHTSLLTETGTTDFCSQSYAGMIGFTNFQDDSFHAGLLYKNYGSDNRVGLRVNVNLDLNRTMFVFIQSDIFGKVAKQDNASFMENSAGLGFRLFKGLSASLGYQMEDYNPVTEIRSEDRVLVKLGYKIRL